MAKFKFTENQIENAKKHLLALAEEKVTIIIITVILAHTITKNEKLDK